MPITALAAGSGGPGPGGRPSGRDSCRPAGIKRADPVKVRRRNVPVSAVPGLFPFLAGPFAHWIGCWYEKARNTFVMSAAALELFLVLTLWTKPELAQATAVVEGFCGMGIQLRAGGFHTLMALLTATAGWRPRCFAGSTWFTSISGTGFISSG